MVSRYFVLGTGCWITETTFIRFLPAAPESCVFTYRMEYEL